jgi:hypothetical protein
MSAASSMPRCPCALGLDDGARLRRQALGPFIADAHHVDDPALGAHRDATIGSRVPVAAVRRGSCGRPPALTVAASEGSSSNILTEGSEPDGDRDQQG